MQPPHPRARGCPQRGRTVEKAALLKNRQCKAVIVETARRLTAPVLYEPPRVLRLAREAGCGRILPTDPRRHRHPLTRHEDVQDNREMADRLCRLARWLQIVPTRLIRTSLHDPTAIMVSQPQDHWMCLPCFTVRQLVKTQSLGWIDSCMGVSDQIAWRWTIVHLFILFNGDMRVLENLDVEHETRHVAVEEVDVVVAVLNDNIGRVANVVVATTGLF